MTEKDINIVKFKAIKENTTAEIVEKKSKFIANIFYVESIEEAEEKIKYIKQKHYDAKHNVFAYCIEDKNSGMLIKYNEDGEPKKTAGAPILEILLNKGLSNILVVVTRYFGGTLLGTGGLVRAYSQVSLDALNLAKIVEKAVGYELELEIIYSELDNFKYYCKKNNIKILKLNYLKNIEIKIEVLENEKEKLESDCLNNLKDIVSFKNIKKKFVEI